MLVSASSLVCSHRFRSCIRASSAKSRPSSLIVCSFNTGQINRHKNQTSGATPVPNAQHRCPYPSIQPDAPLPVYRVAKQKAVSPYGSPYGSRPASPHVRGGGYRRSGVQHRHKSLVLNGASAPSQPPTDSSDASSSDQQPTWVSKTDRHLQLINSSVYEKDSQTRAKAIAETIQQKRQRQDDREKVKLKQFLQAGSAGPTTIATATVRSANEPGAFELDIEGIRFRVAKDGSKLVKLSGTFLSSVLFFFFPCLFGGNLDLVVIILPHTSGANTISLMILLMAAQMISTLPVLPLKQLWLAASSFSGAKQEISTGMESSRPIGMLALCL